MGKIKLLLLSTFLFGQLAFACGSSMTYQNGGQTNTSSPCPTNPNSGSTGVTVSIGGMNYGPGYAEAMAAKERAEKCAASAATLYMDACKQEIALVKSANIERCNYQAETGIALAATGGVGVAVGGIIIGLGSGPIGWTVLVISGAAAVEGGVGNQEGNYRCRDEVNETYDKNLVTCQNGVSPFVKKACSF